MARPRSIRVAVITAALLALLLAVAASASAAGPVPLEYSGKIQFESPTAYSYPPPANFGKFKVSLQWVATADSEGSSPWDFKELKGTVHWDQEGNPLPYPGEIVPPPCDATLSQGSGGEDVAYVAPFEGSESRLEISTQLPLIAELLKSTKEGEGGCAVSSILAGFPYAILGTVEELEKSDAGIEAMRAALAPKLIARAGATTTQHFDFTFNRESPAGAGDPTVLEIHSQIHVGPSRTGGSTESSPGKKKGSGKGSKKSGSAASCKVPKLVGKKLGAAKKALENADCKLGPVAPTGADPKTAKVVKQGTKAGTVLKADAKVAVKVN
jgi:hypothetical protein